MLIFLDTEFTDLLQPQLLSIGLATLAGETFYAELDLTTDIGKARARASTDFVRTGGVLDQWGLVPGSSGTDWEIGRRAGEWLLEVAAKANGHLEIAFDYDVDYELLEFAIRDAGMWDQVREVVGPINIDAITGTITGELASDIYYGELAKRGGYGIKRHHALADAQALREAYIEVKKQAVLRAAEARKPVV